MSLDNLVGRTLERVVPERAGIARMLAAAERNLADYEGEPVTAQSVAEGLAQAQQLLAEVKAWLKANKPELTGEGA
jgi:hypothetical protein